MLKNIKIYGHDIIKELTSGSNYPEYGILVVHDDDDDDDDGARLFNVALLTSVTESPLFSRVLAAIDVA